MGILSIQGGGIYGNYLDALMLNFLTERYIEETPLAYFRVRSFWTDNDSPVSAIENVKYVCSDDWNDFKRWCNTLDIIVHETKRVIDRDKMWWPSVVEITVPQNDETLVWFKLTYEY